LPWEKDIAMRKLFEFLESMSKVEVLALAVLLGVFQYIFMSFGSAEARETSSLAFASLGMSTLVSLLLVKIARGARAFFRKSA
jgi:hypothetical protein